MPENGVHEYGVQPVRHREALDHGSERNGCVDLRSVQGSAEADGTIRPGVRLEVYELPLDAEAPEIPGEPYAVIERRLERVGRVLDVRQGSPRTERRLLEREGVRLCRNAAEVCRSHPIRPCRSGRTE